jgi:hypothetical protein
MIGKGKNWARVTFLVLTILGTPSAIKALIDGVSVGTFSSLLGMFQMAIQFCALILLFRSPAKDWFRKV